MPPIASVIIPTYNRSVLLDFTLQSLNNQNINKSTIEILVIDDGSFDNTKEVVERHSKSLNIKYLFQDDKGYRPGSARNIGINNSNGDILIFIDSGVLLSSECIKAHIQSYSLKARPQVVIGLVYCFEDDDKNSDTIKSIIDINDIDKTIYSLLFREKFIDIRESCYISCNDKINDLPAPWVFFWTCNVSVNRVLLEDIGGFDESFDLSWGVEDIELGYRMHKSNAKFILNREASAIHYPHPRDTWGNQKQQQKNKEYFHNKYNTWETKLFLSSHCLKFNNDIIRG